MDTAKRYFTRLGVAKINECKSVSKDQNVCKQSQPVQLTDVDEECEAQMIEPIRPIPASCSQRNVDRGEFRPRHTRQLPRAVNLKGRLLSCQSY